MGYRTNTFTIEQPHGAGRVLKGADWVADATYSLTVTQVVKAYATLGGNVGETREPKAMTGNIRVTNGDAHLLRHQETGISFSDAGLVLELEDGRRWRFMIASANVLAGVYRIQQTHSDDLG